MGLFTRRRLLGASLGAAGVAGLGGAARAGAAAAPGSAKGLVGAWRLTVTAADPPGLDPFDELATFLADGTVVETRRLYVPDTPFGPLLETPGHGAWERLGPREFAVRFTFLLQGAPDNPALHGAAVGTDDVWWQPRVDGDTVSGPFRSEVRDLSGAAVFAARGTVAGTRMRAERLS